MQWLLFSLLLTAAHGVSSASIEHVIPRAADTTTLTHEAPEADCTEKATLFIKVLDNYLAMWEKEKGVNRMDAIPHSFWFDLAADVPANLLPELSAFAPLLEDFSVFMQLLEYRWMDRWGSTSLSLEEVVCNALEKNTSILESSTPTTEATTTVSATKTESPSTCLIRTKAYIRYFDMFDHYEAWQRYKWVHVYGFIGEYAGIEDYLWDDFLADAPYDHPGFGDLMALLRTLFKNKNRASWDDDRLAEILCEEHTFFSFDGLSEFFDEIDEYAYHYLGYYDYYQGHDVFDDDPF